MTDIPAIASMECIFICVLPIQLPCIKLHVTTQITKIKPSQLLPVRGGIVGALVGCEGTIHSSNTGHPLFVLFVGCFCEVKAYPGSTV